MSFSESILELLDNERSMGVEADGLSADDLRLRYLRATSSGGFGEFISIGKAFEKAGLYQEGIESYSKAIDCDSRSSEGYLYRGEAVLAVFVSRDEQGSERELGAWGCRDLEKASELSLPDDAARVGARLASAYLMTGRYGDGVNLIRELVDLDSNAEVSGVVADLIYLKGFGYLFLDGHLSEAYECFGALQKVPGFENFGWFGEAVCAMVSRDSGRATLAGARVDPLMKMALERVVESGVGNYLSVVRSLVEGSYLEE